MEVYGNSWTASGSYWCAIELRGGTGMVFGNQAPNSSAVWLILQEYYVSYGQKTAADYPIDDQIGVGKDPKVGGSEPMYLWQNRLAGATTEWQISSYSSMDGVIVADRDYFDEVSSFNGASGIGTGTKSQMLAIIPTKKGVGYWVTDEGEWDSTHPGFDGQLYSWTGSAWALKYKPYTYPHPLRGKITSLPKDLVGSDNTNSLQNYPNPFSTETSISFYAEPNASTSLKVYDILGREVKTLLHEVKSAGVQSVRWDGTNSNGIKVGKGIYFCFLKIQTAQASYTKTKKMLLE
jgi:hypothetical protein